MKTRTKATKAATPTTPVTGAPSAHPHAKAPLTAAGKKFDAKLGKLLKLLHDSRAVIADMIDDCPRDWFVKDGNWTEGEMVRRLGGMDVFIGDQLTAIESVR